MRRRAVCLRGPARTTTEAARNPRVAMGNALCGARSGMHLLPLLQYEGANPTTRVVFCSATLPWQGWRLCLLIGSRCDPPRGVVRMGTSGSAHPPGRNDSRGGGPRTRPWEEPVTPPGREPADVTAASDSQACLLIRSLEPKQGDRNDFTDKGRQAMLATARLGCMMRLAPSVARSCAAARGGGLVAPGHVRLVRQLHDRGPWSLPS